MSMQSIYQSSFSLQTRHEQAYSLRIQFSDQKGAMISSRQFDFIQQPSMPEAEIWDIYSQNGVCQQPLFSSRDERDMKKAVKKWSEAPLKQPTILVLDLKDSKGKYGHARQIETQEEEVCDFFKHKTTYPFLSRHAAKIQPLFQNTLDFVLYEGRLKKDLLPAFSDTEAEFFQTTPQGAIQFCQCAEFFMNGFKLGQVTRGIQSADYIYSISGRVFQSFEKSTVWYPPIYQHMYSPSGTFAETLRQVFSVQGSFDPQSKMTSLTVEK